MIAPGFLPVVLALWSNQGTENLRALFCLLHAKRPEHALRAPALQWRDCKVYYPYTLTAAMTRPMKLPMRSTAVDRKPIIKPVLRLPASA